MNRVLTAVLLGAGNRGETYSRTIAQNPDLFRIVAVADPVESRRNYVRDLFQLPDSCCFKDWKELLAQGKIADLAIIATQDRLHFAPTMEAIALHYDILLEKPVAPDPIQCETIAQAAQHQGVRVVVCHVLRYTPLFLTIKKLLSDGALGDIVAINHEEGVGNVHQSHSFVRGNWSNSAASSFMLLAKACHDMDLLQWLVGRPCQYVQSFGTLTYFREENAPSDAPQRCIDGCPHGQTCPYNAVKLYLDDKENLWFRTTCTGQARPTDDMVEQVLHTGPYGRCVFHCNNDVVDHQTVNLQFEGGITAAFTMSAFTKGGRYIHIMGTKGELRAALDGDEPIKLYSFRNGERISIPFHGDDGIMGGHGGGDEGIIHSLHNYLTTGDDGGGLISQLRISVDNHMIAFAAEQARLTNTVVDCRAYQQEICRQLAETSGFAG